MKKKIWTVTPFFLVFTVGILCMAIFSSRWNPYVFVMEMIVALISIVIVFIGMRRFNHHINRTIKIAAEIIRNNKALGIENEENPDGSPNLINQYTYNVVRTFVQALKNDASVQSVIPSGSLSVFAKGANGGGPVICKGSNLFDSIGNGIIQ